MNKNWVACIIATIIGRLLALLGILGFVFHMVTWTNNLHCLWLLFLLLFVGDIPTYEFKREYPINKENKND